MRISALCAALLACGVAASTSQASTVSVFKYSTGPYEQYYDLYYLASPGEANNVTVAQNRQGGVFTETGAMIYVRSGSEYGYVPFGDAQGCVSAVRAGGDVLGTPTFLSVATCSRVEGVSPYCPPLFGPECFYGDLGYDTTYVRTGDGDDVVHARNNTEERINCGPGVDRVEADAADRVSDCEILG